MSVNNNARITRHLVLSLLTSLMGFSSPCHSEDLLDIFNTAIENNYPLLKAAKATQEATQALRTQGLASLLPHLSTSASWSIVSEKNTNIFVTVDEEGNLVDEQGNLLDAQPPNSAKIFQNKTAFINLTQKILDLSSLSKYRSSKAAVLKGDTQYRLAQQNMLLRVVEQYFEVLSKVGNLDFARAEKIAIDTQLNQANQRFKLGIIAITDVHEAKARYDLSVAQEIIAETELANAREGLREMTGLLHIDLLPLKENTPLIPPTPSNINEWTNAALTQNLSIAILTAELDMAKHTTNQWKSNHWPTIDMNLGYGINDFGGINAYSTQEGFIGFNFNLSLYGGNFISSKLSQARHNKQAIEYQLEALKRNILKQTRNAYLGVLAGMSYVKALNQALISSQNALNATAVGFDVGTRTALDVLNAQRELFRAQRDVAQARYDYILNTLRLKHAIGLLTIDDLEQVNGWLG